MVLQDNFLRGTLLPWFINVFSSEFPTYFYLYVWDCLYILGEHFIVLTVFSILSSFKNLILKCSTSSSLFQQVQHIPEYLDRKISLDIVHNALKFYLLIP